MREYHRVFWGLSALTFSLVLGAFSALSSAQSGVDFEMPALLTAASEEVPLVVKPDQMLNSTLDTQRLTIRVMREVQGKATPVVGLSLVTEEANPRRFITDETGNAIGDACLDFQSEFKVRARMETPYFKVGNGGAVYEVEFNVPCFGEVLAQFNEDSVSGRVINVWQSAIRSQYAMAYAQGAEIWKTQLNLLYPQDKYQYLGQTKTLRIHEKVYSDYVVHMIGHAIFDFGKLGEANPKKRKIDECETPEIAFEEGWAHFFAAWARFPQFEAKPELQSLVPEWTPVSLETVSPEKVCLGPTNEWRVAAFFWDLYDSAADEEQVSIPWLTLWNALKGRDLKSVDDAYRNLVASGIPQADLEWVWKKNFLTAPPSLVQSR